MHYSCGVYNIEQQIEYVIFIIYLSFNHWYLVYMH